MQAAEWLHRIDDKLPDAALGDWIHRTASRTLVGSSELGRVRQRADYPVITIQQLLYKIMW